MYERSRRALLTAHIWQTPHVAWNGSLPAPVAAGDSTSNTSTGFVPVSEHQMAHGVLALDAGCSSCRYCSLC